MGYYNPFGYTFWSPYNVYGFINTLPYYGGGYYLPGTGSTGGRPVIHPPTKIPNGITPAAVAMRSVVAANHAGRMAAASGGSFGHGGGGGFSSGSTGTTSSSHSSSMSSMGAGHAGGGGGGHK
jgi:hypothetical protein